MTTFTAYFRTDADFATREFKATSPKRALLLARKFLDGNAEDLMFEEYDAGMPVNEVAIKDPHGDDVAIWYDDDLRLRLAASDLRDALEDQTAAAQSVVENWAKGDLAAAVRALDACIPTARAAMAKAKGGRR